MFWTPNLSEALGGKVEKSSKGWGVGVHRYERKLDPKWSKIVEIILGMPATR